MNSGSPGPAVATPVPDAQPVPGDKTKETNGSSLGPAVEMPALDVKPAPGDKVKETK